MMPLGVLASSRVVGGKWIGEAPTVPAGAGAVVLRLHTGQDPYPSWMTVGGSAATLLGTAGDYVAGNSVTRLLSAWWCPNPGPGGALAANVLTTNIEERHHWTLYTQGFHPGEVQTGSNNTNTAITQHAPALDPGGLMLSCYSVRPSGLATAGHTYIDSGAVSSSYAYAVRAAWTVGDDQPTKWTGYRNHSLLSVALNPGV